MVNADLGSEDELQSELARLGQAASGNGHLLVAQMDRKRREAEVFAKQLNESLEELQGLGCELKGIDEGLVDFPAEREGRTVYLCWKRGEAPIRGSRAGSGSRGSKLKA